MVSYIDAFMHATAWAMEKPAPYGTFHLTYTFVGLAVAILLAWFLRNLSDKGNRIFLTAVGVFLVICEAYKQLFHTYYIMDHTYAWWIFPFQLCSVPMYLCLIAPWLKKGKLQQAMYCFMMTYNLLGGAMAFIEPSGIVLEYWTLTLHAFTWHMSLIFIGIYLFLSGRGGVSKADFVLSTKLFGALCLIAFALNLALRRVSGGEVNNFYIGPTRSPLIIIKQISELCGWYVGTVLYIPAVILGAFLICLLLRRIARGINKEKELVAA
ncbi:MAG: YwaF family protein [Oscillospiraceae bacterium]|nr:YwaF family protein [Oscillospiraceae bacterium]